MRRRGVNLRNVYFLERFRWFKHILLQWFKGTEPRHAALVVTRNAAFNTIALGIPAKIIRKIDLCLQDMTMQQKKSVKYGTISAKHKNLW